MNLFKSLQKLGKALMTPVSVLPAAGILVAIGRMLIDLGGFSENIGLVMFNGGLAIFENLPLIFALGVAIGFADKVVAVLAAGVGYLVYEAGLSIMGELLNISGMTGSNINVINTGVFGGIIIGLVAAKTYQRFHNTQLPPYLGFFSGKRLVPILTVFFSLLISVAIAFIWPYIQLQVNNFANYAMDSPLGPAFYAAGKRALIPVGAHHVYYPPFLYEFGRYTTATGEVLRGETVRYFAGDPSAGYFMASEFPIMLFGLPAACLAMFLRADKGKRKAVAGVMMTAALTSFLTGITEPIEFSFIFVAPLLYIFHIFGAFLSGFLTSLFEIRLGYTFSASIIDYFLGIKNAGNPLMFWTVVGPLIGALYFSVFYFAIPFFDFETPGREKEVGAIEDDEEISDDLRVELIIEAVGGKENIIEVDACITRLRLELKNLDLVNKQQLKKAGSAGVMKTGSQNLQIIFGTESDQIKDDINDFL